MSHPALTQLRALRYFKEIPALDTQLLDWLLLEDSMTKRFEQQGKTVSVTMIREGFVEQNEIPEELPLLPKESRYWLTVACRSYRRSCVNVKRAGAGVTKIG